MTPHPRASRGIDRALPNIIIAVPSHVCLGGIDVSDFLGNKKSTQVDRWDCGSKK